VVNQPNPNRSVFATRTISLADHCRISPNNTEDWETVGNRAGDPSDSRILEGQSCANLNETGLSCGPAISRVRDEPVSFPGRKVFLTWDDPGLPVGPNNSYITSSTAGQPAFVAWVSQLNLTYTPLTITGPNSGSSYQPPNEVFETDPAVNGTVFIALTDSDIYLTPFNLTLINPRVRALGLFNAG
jgi:hypothetical protein